MALPEHAALREPLAHHARFRVLGAVIADLASVGERDVRVLQGPDQVLYVVVVERIHVRRNDQERVAGGGLASSVECAPEGEIVFGDRDDLASRRPRQRRPCGPWSPSRRGSVHRVARDWAASPCNRRPRCASSLNARMTAEIVVTRPASGVPMRCRSETRSAGRMSYQELDIAVDL